VALDNQTNPREYLGSFWIDSATHDPQLLRYIMEVVGSEKITLGTDYPFPLGDLEIGKFIEEMNIPTEDLANIFYKAPLQWLGMKEEDFI
jgi:aminocarboxymuconate-semialdehyde decarboxylase